MCDKRIEKLREFVKSRNQMRNYFLLRRKSGKNAGSEKNNCEGRG